MLRVHLAEARDSWTAWAGVSLTFVVVNAALVLPALILASGIVAVAEGRLDFTGSAAFTAVPVLLIVMVCFVAFPVISSSTRLVVDSRRGALARLALAGAAPGQVRRVVQSQLAIVSLACAVAGSAIGAALLRPMLDLTNYAQRNEPLWVRVDPVYSPVAALVAVAACVVVALVGGTRQASAASRIPPVEALRQSQAPEASTRLRAGGWVALVLLVVVAVGSFASVPFQAAHRYKETVSNLMILGFLQSFVWGALIAVLGPVVVRPLTAAWTRLVPSTDPGWLLARATVSVRADRLYRSVTPVLFCVGIAISDLGVMGSLAASLEASMPGMDMGAADLSGFVMVFGLPLAVAFAGAIGSLLMMSRQRDAELALLGIAGATGNLRLRIPVLEAVIITVTATILALGMVVPGYAFGAFALPAVGLLWVPVFPVLPILAVVAACLVIMVAATVLPTLPARRIPEPRVIARLVAE
ncbi:MAG: hypothetical protein KDB60_01090 [Propionibacteriaceae bacterium]|nr:hypothetical protein [Propionibacteriaceae bacterium]